MTGDQRPLPAATWGRMQTLLAVVEHGSIRAAAQALHVSPPAVSAAISAIERELGTALFAKAGRGIRLTDAGRTFAGYCRTITGLLDEARGAVREADRARLRVGAVATAGEFVLPRLMASFVRRFPRVELSLSVLPRDELFAQVHHHEVDVVLAGRPPRGSGLLTRARRHNSLILVGNPSHVRDPLTDTWLLRGPGSGTRETATGLLAQLEAAPPDVDTRHPRGGRGGCPRGPRGHARPRRRRQPGHRHWSAGGPPAGADAAQPALAPQHGAAADPGRAALPAPRH